MESGWNQSFDLLTRGGGVRGGGVRGGGARFFFALESLTGVNRGGTGMDPEPFESI